MHLGWRGSKARRATGLLTVLFGALAASASACSLTVDTDDLSTPAGDTTSDRDASLSDAAASATDGAPDSDAATSPVDATLPDATLPGDDDASADADAAVDAARTDYVGLVLAAGPLAYYRFEEESSVIAVSEVSPAMYNGAYDGEYTQGGEGALGPDGGHAIRFLGVTSNDFGNMKVSNAFAFAGDAPFTYEMWFRALVVDSSYREIFVHGANAGQYGVDWENSGTSENNLFFAANPASGTKYLDSQIAFPTNEWNYFVLTYDGTTITLYKNASPCATALLDVNGGVDAAAADNTLYIGSSAGGGYNEFYGDVDELAVYDHALDETTIRAHYAAAIAVQPVDGGASDAGSDAK